MMAGAVLWNSLPIEWRQAQTLQNFGLAQRYFLRKLAPNFQCMALLKRRLFFLFLS